MEKKLAELKDLEFDRIEISEEDILKAKELVEELKKGSSGGR